MRSIFQQLRVKWRVLRILKWGTSYSTVLYGTVCRVIGPPVLASTYGATDTVTPATEYFEALYVSLARATE